jgi:hypothetical protein
MQLTRQRRRPRVAEHLAVIVAGFATGMGLIVRSLPAVMGILLVSGGFYMIRPYLGVLALGAFLLLADRKVP